MRARIIKTIPGLSKGLMQSNIENDANEGNRNNTPILTLYTVAERVT